MMEELDGDFFAFAMPGTSSRAAIRRQRGELRVGRAKSFTNTTMLIA